MQEIIGNIWDFHPKNSIIITTNMVVKRNGHLVMGKGLALEMRKRYPEFPALVAHHHSKVKYWVHYNVFTFPTKYHWRGNSDINLIHKGLNELLTIVSLSKLSKFDKIYVPPLGCGNGNLDWENEVKPLMKQILNDHFIVVLKG